MQARSVVAPSGVNCTLPDPRERLAEPKDRKIAAGKLEGDGHVQEDDVARPFTVIERKRELPVFVSSGDPSRHTDMAKIEELDKLL